MKKFAATLCIAGTAIALSACDTTGMGNVDTEPPYTLERTTGNKTNTKASPAPSSPAPAERVFRQYQTK